MEDKDAIINVLRQQVNGLHYEVLEQKSVSNSLSERTRHFLLMCIFIKILNFTSRNLLTYLKKWGIIVVMSDEITNKILHLYTYGKKDELKTLRNQLLVEQAKIEKFLSKFLDMFERKMSYE